MRNEYLSGGIMDGSSTFSVKICQEGHANALALNKDCSQIAVAGRSLLKVYQIDAFGFYEVCNMRGGKNQNLSYSSNDVAWNMQDNNLIATAATNGVISVWDISRPGRQKQSHVYIEHERTAHSVTFHNTDANLLISGSQDGTIKCFDLRMEKAVNTYFSNSESVRDVKFSPHQPHTFAAVSENGTIQLWDLKRPDKCQLQFTAHSGPIYTSDWHPTQPWLATGSRDKQIKVWNMEQKPVLEYTIHTIAVVGRVKWRPDRTHHIASCALVVDYSIYIWDVRRPYIPYASFNEHSNITTGIAWKENNAYCILSTSKDSTLCKHSFKNAVHPAKRANPQGSSLNQKGEILLSYKIKDMYGLSSLVSTRALFNRPRSQIPDDNFHIAKSALYCYIPAKEKLMKEHHAFIACVNEYVFTGKTFVDICDHNLAVIKRFNKPNISLLWNFLKITYCLENYNRLPDFNVSSLNQHLFPHRLLSLHNMDVRSNTWQNEETNFKDKTNSFGTNQLESIIINHHNHASTNISAVKISFGNKTESNVCNEIVYGETEMRRDCIDFKSLRNGFLYVGSNEINTNWPITSKQTLSKDFVPTKTQEIITESRSLYSPPSEAQPLIKLSCCVSTSWLPHCVLANALILQTDLGDVQTTVCMLIALGAQRNKLPIDQIVYESWLFSYIEMLHRHQFWIHATHIINLSWIRAVSELNQQSTTVHTNCGDCGKALTSTSGWYCNKCKSSRSSKCAVCNFVVKGMYVWCIGCAHGGHLLHMRNWFEKHSKCPKCGHLCEYQ